MTKQNIPTSISGHNWSITFLIELFLILGVIEHHNILHRSIIMECLILLLTFGDLLIFGDLLSLNYLIKIMN